MTTLNRAAQRFAVFIMVVLPAIFSYPVISSGKDSGLVAAYGFEENSSVVTDSSGLGNSGTASGATWTSRGKYGGAFSFDGDRDTITASDSTSLDIVANLTIEAWLYPDDERNGRLVTKMSYPNGSGYDLLLWNAGYNPILGSTFDRTAGVYEVDRWQHIALVKSGTTATLYKNGLPIITWTDAPAAIGANSAPLIIGGVFSYFFRGIIDEVRIYNRALAQAEIQFDMDAPVVTTDAVPPTVRVTAPPEDGAASGTAATVSATASDNVSGTFSVPPTLTLFENLRLGMILPEVRRLQEFLQALGYFPKTQTLTDLFDATTRDAVVSYQRAKGVEPASGFVGPLTRAAMAAGTAASLPPAPQTKGGQITRTLLRGLQGDDVIFFQKKLQSAGFFPAAQATTGYFGNITEKAVRAFQCAKAIVCGGDQKTTGYGAVGPRTRAALVP